MVEVDDGTDAGKLEQTVLHTFVDQRLLSVAAADITHRRLVNSQEAAALFTFSGLDEAPCHASNLQVARRHPDNIQPLNPFQPLRATHSEERLFTMQRSAMQQEVAAQEEVSMAAPAWHVLAR